MKKWIPRQALMSSSWLRSREIQKCVLLVGALTTGVIIVTWKIQSGKFLFGSSSSEVEILEIKKQGAPQKCCPSSILDLPSKISELMNAKVPKREDIQSKNLITSRRPTCGQCNNSQGDVTGSREEYLPSHDCCMSDSQHEFELSGIKFENDTFQSLRSVNNGQYANSYFMSSSPGSMEHTRNGNGTPVVHNPPLSTSSSLGFSSTLNKADTLATTSSPIYEQSESSNSETVPQNDCVVPSFSGRYVHVIHTTPITQFYHQRCWRPSSRTSSYLTSKDIKSTSLKLTEALDIFKSVPPGNLSLLRGKMPDPIDSSPWDDSYQLNKQFADVFSNQSEVKASSGVTMCEEMYQLVDSNENYRGSGMKNMVTKQESYLAKLHDYEHYLMDPKLSLHMKSQVERAKACLRKYYQMGES